MEDSRRRREILLKEVEDVRWPCFLTDKIDAELFDTANKFKVVSNYAVGFDNIDLEEASKEEL